MQLVSFPKNKGKGETAREGKKMKKVSLSFFMFNKEREILQVGVASTRAHICYYKCAA